MDSLGSVIIFVLALAPMVITVAFIVLIIIGSKNLSLERADMMDRIMFANDKNAMDYKKVKLYEERVKKNDSKRKESKQLVQQFGKEEYVSALEAQQDPALMKKVREELIKNQQNT